MGIATVLLRSQLLRVSGSFYDALLILCVITVNKHSDWEFWSDKDPTNGIVDYQTVDQSWDKGLIYMDDQSRVSRLQLARFPSTPELIDRFVMVRVGYDTSG